jgi:polyhydroxybutyrate depolymerase
MKVKLPLACLALFSVAAAQTTEERTLQFAGQPRTYRVHVASSYDGSKPVALVIGFHGGGGTSQTAEKGLGFNPLSDRHGFIAVYPQGLDSHWNDGRVGARFPTTNQHDDVGFVRALVKEVCANWKIDRRRIFSVGNSNGGFFGNRLAWEAPDIFAAVSAGAGTIGQNVEADFAPKGPVAMLEFHGTKDPMVPFDGGEVGDRGGTAISARKMTELWAKANGCAAKPKVEEVPDTKVTRETYTGCRAGADVVFYIVHGGGHGWPSKKTVGIDAAEISWEFFAKHPKQELSAGP